MTDHGPERGAAPRVAAAKTRHGDIFYLAEDDPIGRCLALYGEWAEAEIGVLAGFIGLGSTVVDIGANAGTHSLAFARRVGPHGRVLAFEPQPVLHGLLRRSLDANQLAQVELHRAGIGGEAGEMRLPAVDYGVPVNSGGITLLPAEAAPEGEAVPILTLDSFALPACALVKADVEGMEAAVLSGMRDTLARLNPVLFLECNSVAAAAAILQARDWSGYRLFLLRTGVFNPENFRGAMENLLGHAAETGLLCVPEAALPLLPAQLRLAEAIPVSDLDEAAAALLATPRYGDPLAYTRDPARLGTALAAAERRAEAADAARSAAEAQAAAASETARDAMRAEHERMAMRCANLESQIERLLDTPFSAHVGHHPGGAGVDPALLAAAREEVMILRNSTSWRVTAPLRHAIDALRSLGRRS